MTQILKIAVAKPIRGVFDYLPPKDTTVILGSRGVRVLVPFGRSNCVGYLMDVVDDSTLPPHRLKRALAFLDEEPLMAARELEVLLWSASYYHHPIGESIAAGFPQMLRHVSSSEESRSVRCFGLTHKGRVAREATAKGNAPRQTEVLAILSGREGGVAEQELNGLNWDWRRALRALIDKGWVHSWSERPKSAPISDSGLKEQPKVLNAEQQLAVDKAVAALGTHKTFLLDGVTGSGKTEVYLQVVGEVLARNGQALILLPEIALTPQLEARFRSRFRAPIVVFHSSMTETTRRDAWLAMQRHEAAIMLGTRSAVFTPMQAPGLIVVDEEHDPSYKQQEGFRYSGRDVAVMRAAKLGIPVILGSATPSLESLANVARKRYRHVRLRQRAGTAVPPRFAVLDIRGKKLMGGVSEALIGHMRATLERGEQVLLFLNRRGFSPSLICHGCGWVGHCRRCDSHLVLHVGEQRLCCHHCGFERAAIESCPSCESDDLRPTGLGTERVEKALDQIFPKARISRIDRDSTRRKGTLELALDDAREGRTDILLGTQMLAKGHHFSGVTLVGILDVDAGLFSADFRAAERTAQLIVQVAGRAGRESLAGSVVLQTRHPNHPLLAQLIGVGYGAFAKLALEERRTAGLPPYSHHVLLRADANETSLPKAFLSGLAELARGVAGIEVYGPVAAPMARKAGRFRHQLLLQSLERKPLHALVTRLIEEADGCPQAKRVRWSVDVDPIEFA